MKTALTVFQVVVDFRACFFGPQISDGMPCRKENMWACLCKPCQDRPSKWSSSSSSSSRSRIVIITNVRPQIRKPATTV